MISQKKKGTEKGMTTTSIDRTIGSFNIKLRHQMSDHIFYKQLPIEDGNNFVKIMSNDNSIRTIKIINYIFQKNRPF